MRFSDLERAIPNITQKMLGQQLRGMAADGIRCAEIERSNATVPGDDNRSVRTGQGELSAPSNSQSHPAREISRGGFCFSIA